MADKKISQMALLSAVDLNPAVDYLPIVDPSEPAAADQNKRILVSSIVTNAIDTGTLVSVARTNPLAQAVSVQMTAAASGSNGIQQLDNDNLDMGTNDFTLHWEGSLPTYNLTLNSASLLRKLDGTAGYQTTVLSRKFRIYIGSASGAILNNTESTVNINTADGAYVKLTAVVTRETALSAGSVVLYENGIQLGAAITISAAATATLSNAGNFFSLTSSTVRSAGNFQLARLFNRALTSAEVLSLSINGVALADRGATQTERVTNGSFDSDITSWTVGGNITAAFSSGEAEINLNGAYTSTSGNWFFQGSIFSDTSKRYTLEFDATHISGAGSLVATSGFKLITVITAAANGGVKTRYKITFVPIDLTGSAINLDRLAFSGGTATTATWKIDNVTVKQTGITSEILASNAQSDTGQIFDTSGNKNHALLPASGATVVGRPVSQTREVRWTNTWDGTNELQYIGGVNQAILPANAYIESIVGTVSGATPHDIIIGDGSDTDRYVTITTGLAAGTTNFALAARTTDGTNLKLTVDPDTDATMSIAWVISYSTLEA
jgi:hypothetical protein